MPPRKSRAMEKGRKLWLLGSFSLWHSWGGSSPQESTTRSWWCHHRVVMTSAVVMDITTGSEGFQSESHFPDLTGKPLIGKIFGRSAINWQLFWGRMGTVLLLLLLSTHDVIYGRLGQPLSTSWEARLPMRFSCRGREVYRISLNSETKTVK